MLTWIKKLFAPKRATPVFDPETATVEELQAESQRLAVEQDAIKAQRRALAVLIDNRLTGV